MFDEGKRWKWGNGLAGKIALGIYLTAFEIKLSL